MLRISYLYDLIYILCVCLHIYNNLNYINYKFDKNNIYEYNK